MAIAVVTGLRFAAAILGGTAFTDSNSRKADVDFLFCRRPKNHIWDSHFKTAENDMSESFQKNCMHILRLKIIRRMVFLTAAWYTQENPFLRIATTEQTCSKDSATNLLQRFRVCPTVSDLKYWKASEYQQLPFYIWQVVLKDAISRQHYENFVTLSCRPSSVQQQVVATTSSGSSWFNISWNFTVFYARVGICKNVHIHGSLAVVSAFPSESHKQNFHQYTVSCNMVAQQAFHRATKRPAEAFLQLGSTIHIDTLSHQTARHGVSGKTVRTKDTVVTNKTSSNNILIHLTSAVIINFHSDHEKYHVYIRTGNLFERHVISLYLKILFH